MTEEEQKKLTEELEERYATEKRIKELELLDYESRIAWNQQRVEIDKDKSKADLEELEDVKEYREVCKKDIKQFQTFRTRILELTAEQNTILSRIADALAGKK